MQNQPSSPPKPVTDVWQPDLVALPRLTFARRAFRIFFRGLAKLVTFFTMRPIVSGLENFPKRGPALIVINHLGDADVVLVGASIPTTIDGMGKIELIDEWVGPILRAYGVIWVHRGRPDRRALRAALDALAQGRMVGLAPEGRQSVTGGLEDGNEGAAFLAMKSGAPIVPIAMTGTENENTYGHLKRWKRARVTLTVGKPFLLREQADRQAMLREGTRQIMESLANLLPESYRGNYKPNSESG
ncbi:MAG: 1-acyl-sn-glycerol-3-phosphate acyltransferase [Anaerolineae bacterium]|nr:1-acyl-sn-glycerol-3-phosphate acyltransferase [Anaerolineae bacterium]MCI0611258.1 1-acyl-sn-glycerol-3-phosphate acyltransferase [Anaerolineae bacterium]